MELRACRRSVALTYPIETRAGGPGVVADYAARPWLSKRQAEPAREVRVERKRHPDLGVVAEVIQPDHGVFGEEPDLAPAIAFRNVDDERRALVAGVFLENAPGRLMRQEEIGLLAREQDFIDRRAPAIGPLFGGPGLRHGLLVQRLL